MLLISGFICISFSTFMFFILKLISIAYPKSILNLDGEKTINYLDINLSIFPITLGLVGLILIASHLYIQIIQHNKNKNDETNF